MLYWLAKRMRELQEVSRDERGFTLIELLVVMIIIAILAAIAIPTFLAQRTKAQQAGCVSDTRNAATAGISYGADTDGDYTLLDFQALTDNGFNQTPGNTTTIPTHDTNGFSLSTACASGNGDTVTWDSDTGTLTRSWAP